MAAIELAQHLARRLPDLVSLLLLLPGGGMDTTDALRQGYASALQAGLGMPGPRLWHAELAGGA